MSGSKRELGNKGEEIAFGYLTGLNYQILESNWRFGRAEIDLIANDGNCLVFIEVKTRLSNYSGEPEMQVNRKKMEMISMASGEYMEQCNWTGEIRYDIISVLWKHGKDPVIHHIADAFFPIQ